MTDTKVCFYCENGEHEVCQFFDGPYFVGCQCPCHGRAENNLPKAQKMVDSADQTEVY